jgi:hypothetical protein|tara:strand:+ start:920 stop:1150 length:231 start_codon:yes stop_codon:yes gene_type:complete
MSDVTQEYDNTNRGAMFKNSRKEKDTHPDLGGTINVEGKEFFINAWKKESRKGVPFYSLSVKEKVAKEAVAEEAPF